MPTTARHFPAAVTAAALLCALLTAPAPASADWLISGFVGGTSTASNTLTITPPAGLTLSIPSGDYQGKPWESPIYYGYRVGWKPEERHLGYEVEFTHAKAIATALASTDLTAFQLSHGLNFVLANVVYRTSPLCDRRCTFLIRGGAGVTYPHVEASFRGRDTSEYQFAGFGGQGGAGLEVKLVDHLFLAGDARVTYASVHADLVDGSSLKAPFTTFHAAIGIGWRSGR
jgi:hypothetical protein